MPTRAEHIAQADHDRDFWTSLPLDSTPFLDWVVTGIFYEGVHRVEAFLSTRGEHSESHSHRLLALLRNRVEMGPIIDDIETLKQESENARYKCHKYTKTEISNDLIPIADKIKNHVEGVFRSLPHMNP